MYNLAELSNDEIKYICERMHLPSVRLYFQKNPKEFNKIKPGFTVKRMSDEATLSFLLSNRQIRRILKKEWSRTNKVQLHNRYSYKEK